MATSRSIGACSVGTRFAVLTQLESNSCRCSSCDGSESQNAFARPDQLPLARPPAASTQHRLS